jgi:hypothetical protein
MRISVKHVVNSSLLVPLEAQSVSFSIHELPHLIPIKCFALPYGLHFIPIKTDSHLYLSQIN